MPGGVGVWLGVGLRVGVEPRVGIGEGEAVDHLTRAKRRRGEERAMPDTSSRSLAMSRHCSAVYAQLRDHALRRGTRTHLAAQGCSA